MIETKEFGVVEPNPIRPSIRGTQLWEQLWGTWGGLSRLV